MSPKSSKSALNFEQTTKRLEEIIDRINSSETGLEDTISLVEEGLALVRNSRKLLAEAELKIKKLETLDTADVSAVSEKKDSPGNDFSLL